MSGSSFNPRTIQNLWLCLICACFLRLLRHKSPGQNGNVGWARLDTSALRIHLVRPPRWFHGPEPTPQGAGWSRLRLTLTSRTFMPLSLHASSAVSKCGKGRRWMRQEPDVHSSKSIFNKLPHRIFRNEFNHTSKLPKDSSISNLCYWLHLLCQEPLDCRSRRCHRFDLCLNQDALIVTVNSRHVPMADMVQSAVGRQPPSEYHMQIPAF